MSVMNDQRIKLLVVGDNPPELASIQNALANEQVDVCAEANGEAALERFLELRPRIVLSDVALPGINGIELLDRVLAHDPATDFILMSDYYSKDAVVAAISRGARNYLAKPLDLDKLKAFVRELLAEADMRSQTSRLDHGLLDAYQFEGLIGRSPLMLEVFTKIRRIAPHFQSVLLTGPTGTGKELVARALHRLNPASGGPFAICNCSALVESLVETELFGCTRGAFTGATQGRQGVFEYANGGTVFLDEVGELSLPAQAKLLRVLQNREVQRVGSPILHKINVRVIAATHRNLRKMVADGQFREDLFYRLSAVEISTPPLAQRKEDIPLLLMHFLEKFSNLCGKRIKGITRRAQVQLALHTWPGNVRELENVVEGSCMMASGDLIDLSDLPEILRASADPSPHEQEDQLATLEAIQHRHVMRVLKHVAGNKAKAAEILGVGRTTIYEILKRMEARSGTDSLSQKLESQPFLFSPVSEAIEPSLTETRCHALRLLPPTQSAGSA